MSRRTRAAARSGRRPAGAVFDGALEEPGLLEAELGARRVRAARRQEAAEAAASPMIDRAAAARAAQARVDAASAQGRRRRRRAAAVLGAALLLSAAALGALSPLASVRDIVVAGADRTGPAAVREASGLEDGPPLLRVDAEEVTTMVQRLAWVQRVTVERRWPRTVVLTVEERQPAAVAPCEASASAGCLVDGSGRVLAPATADQRAAASLPRVAGVPPAGEPGSWLPDLARAALTVALDLPPALRPLVREVRGEGNEVVLDLRAPGREGAPPVVRLGGPDRIHDKMTAAATVLARTSVNGVAVLDVRVPESPALTRLAR